MDMTPYGLPVRTGAGSEGGHWYDPGPPVRCCYEVQGANGKWRPANLRDARKFGWYPGVTTITRVAASPGLERWKVRQGIMAALTHPKAHEITDAQELIRMLEEDSKQEGRLAAEKGTKIHAAIETFFRDGTVDTEYADYVTGVRKCLHRLTGVDDPSLWVTEEACCHPYGVGTRIDLYSRELGVVVDFKGKEFGPKETVKAYDNQGQQLAVCKEMLGMPEARAVNLFVSRNHPGVVYPYEWEPSSHDRLWRSFVLLLAYWQLTNDMPTRVLEAA